MRPTPFLLRNLRRKPLTTKQTNKGYYKGNRTGAMGRHTKHGGYVIEWAKVRTYVVPPELKMFKVGNRCSVRYLQQKQGTDARVNCVHRLLP